MVLTKKIITFWEKKSKYGQLRLLQTVVELLQHCEHLFDMFFKMLRGDEYH